MFALTPRLLLRPIWPEDWRAIHAACSDYNVVRNLARAPWPYREQDARAFAALEQDLLHPHFLITRPTGAGSEVLGSVGLARDEEGRAELGYWIARPHWGRGYASEAGRMVLEIAATLGHRSIIASHFVDNPASGAVLRKLGFARTGRIVARASRSRGCDVPACEFALDLRERCAAVPQDVSEAAAA